MKTISARRKAAVAPPIRRAIPGMAGRFIIRFAFITRGPFGRIPDICQIVFRGCIRLQDFRDNRFAASEPISATDQSAPAFVEFFDDPVL